MTLRTLTPGDRFTLVRGMPGRVFTVCEHVPGRMTPAADVTVAEYEDGMISGKDIIFFSDEDVNKVQTPGTL